MGHIGWRTEVSPAASTNDATRTHAYGGSVDRVILISRRVRGSWGAQCRRTTRYRAFPSLTWSTASLIWSNEKVSVTGRMP